MLLQVYNRGMDTRELDTALVYDTYWQRRVVQDLRHGAHDACADTTDLSWPAQAGARLMLHDGVVALPALELTSRMPAATPPPPATAPSRSPAWKTAASSPAPPPQPRTAPASSSSSTRPCTSTPPAAAWHASRTKPDSPTTGHWKPT
ncbi:hypothetical protein ACFQ0M_01025 [Kitasatospora aburaviensis]